MNFYYNFFRFHLDDVANSVILLINTIYFNGFWSKPFAENDTAVQNFFISPQAVVPVQFMTRTDDYYYSESTELDAKVLRLPYKVLMKRLTIVENTRINRLFI